MPRWVLVLGLFFFAGTCFYAGTCFGSGGSCRVVTGQRSPAFQVPDALGNLGGGMLDVYHIYLQSCFFNLDVTGFDITFAGEFAQVQTDMFGSHLPTPFRSDLEGFDPALIAQDTHFVPEIIEAGPPIPPATEGTITPPLGFSGSGLGQDLVSHQVAIAGSDQAPTVLVAQIVFPAGTVNGTFQGVFAVTGNGSAVFVSGTFGVPEPSTAVLAVLVLPLFFARQRFRLS